MIARLTVPEIAEKYGRTVRQVEWWRHRYDWPAPAGQRGRYAEYDAADVDQAVRAILAVPADDADPGELLDARQAAAEAGISYGTVRSNISKARNGDPSKWPAPDGSKNGRDAWKRSTIRAYTMTKKPNRRRHADRGEA